MKKLLLLGLTSLFFLSCSGDDTTAPVNLNQSGLIKMKQKIYNQGQIEAFYNMNFSSGVPVNGDYYYADNTLASHSVYNYDNEGLLISTVSYSPTNIEIGRTDYLYDSQGRIYKVVRQEGTYQNETTYTFNSDNTITSSTVSTDSDIPRIKTFYINNLGIVYKEVRDNYTYELTFDGYNPVSAQSPYDTKTFVYDEVNLPVSAVNPNMLGSYKPNLVLRTNYLMDAEKSTATKYILQEISNNETITHQYTFNDEGYPVLKKDYRNNILKSEMEYIYE